MRSGALAGTAALVRFVLRRDRVRILVWLGAIAVLVMSSAASVAGLYPTAESLAQAATLIEGNAVIMAFNGPAQGVDTLGGRVAFELGAFTFVTAALMSVFMISRLTRADEENGRTELLLSAPLGRYAPAASAVVVVTAMNLVLGVLVAVGLISQNLPTTGSVAFGAAMTATGLVFAGVALVAAQATESARVVTGSSGAAVALAYVIRAAGDVGDGTLSWASPLGWGQKVRAFAGEQWWPLLLSIGFAMALVVVAGALIERHDVGAALLAPRPGPATATPRLGSPLGLAWRLQRGTVLWWAIGIFLTGLAYGSVADSVDEFVQDNEAMRDMIAAGGGDLTDAFFGTTLLMLGFGAAGYAVQATLRLRSEETAGRVEPLLATPMSRAAWLGSHLAVALVGSALVVAAGGFGLGLTYGIISGDLSEAPRLTGLALVYLPAVWLMAGAALALIGVLPRAALAAWGALGAIFVLGFFGSLLDLPESVRAVSPYEHIPLVPSEPTTVVPMVIITALAVAFVVLGLVAFRRRDLA